MVIVSGSDFTCFSITAAEAEAPNVLLDMKLLNRFLGRVNVLVSKYLSSSVTRNIYGQQEKIEFYVFAQFTLTIVGSFDRLPLLYNRLNVIEAFVTWLTETI